MFRKYFMNNINWEKQLEIVYVSSCFPLMSFFQKQLNIPQEYCQEQKALDKKRCYFLMYRGERKLSKNRVPLQTSLNHPLTPPTWRGDVSKACLATTDYFRVMSSIKRDYENH